MIFHIFFLNVGCLEKKGHGRNKKQQKRGLKNKVIGAINAPVIGSHLL